LIVFENLHVVLQFIIIFIAIQQTKKTLKA